MNSTLSLMPGLFGGFWESLHQWPERPALEIDERIYSYQELGEIVGRIANAILSLDACQERVAALLAYRSLSAYAGALGILAAGLGYVPLNPRFPTERTLRMLTLSQARILIVGGEALTELKDLLPRLSKPMTILCPDVEAINSLSDLYPQHRFLLAGDIQGHPTVLVPPKVQADDTAYLLFTSGSTGDPKGVPVSHGNVSAYLSYTWDRYAVQPTDRFSQMFDLTFDLSVHDLFVCWGGGACLCVVPEKITLAPADFIRQKRLTMWFSVPSVAMFLGRYRMLPAGAFPSLRYSLFCGEALPANLADQWQKAAPNSIVENLYGPTEATIAITNYRWDAKKSPAECLNGLTPIGWPFSGQRCAVIDAQRKPLPAGEAGELCLSGSQVTRGYLNNPAKTREQYIVIPELGEATWYRTGDLVRQDENGCLHYLGRIDNQVKIFGHRVELGEIDAVLRQASGSEMAVSIAWPVTEGQATGVVAFICPNQNHEMPSETQIQEYCKAHLPAYMIPKKVYFLETLPLNVNGKIDRLKLAKILEEGNL